MTLDGLIQASSKIAAATWPTSLALGLLLYVFSDFFRPGLQSVLTPDDFEAWTRVFLLGGSAGLLVAFGRYLVRLSHSAYEKVFPLIRFQALTDSERLILGIFAATGIDNISYESGDLTVEQLVDQGLLQENFHQGRYKNASLAWAGQHLVSRCRARFVRFVDHNEERAKALAGRMADIH